MQIIIENIIIKARKKFKNLFIQSATCKPKVSKEKTQHINIAKKFKFL
jgi:hypothetical protein